MKTFTHQWTFKLTQSHWNRIATKFEGGFVKSPTTEYYRRREIALFKRAFGDIRGKKLLKLDLWNEVNNTRILEWVIQQGVEIYGLDISDVIVEKAKEIFNGRAQFIVSDIRNIQFPSSFFDCVYTMGTIEHVPDYHRAIKEVFRVLKPGGTAVIGVPNKLDPFLRPVLVFVLDQMGLYPYSPEKAFTYQELSKLMIGSGFKIKETTGIMFLPGLIRMVDLFCWRRNVKRVSKLTDVLSKPFEWLEERSTICRKLGYLAVFVVQKPV